LRAAGTTAAGVLLAPAARASTQPVAPPRVIGANDRINVGVIGCGGRGMSHVRMMVRAAERKTENIQVVAVCDIYEPRKERARSMTGGTLYHDYRKLLENKDIDAVVIATPEHWHARQAVETLEAGKDLYLEKPMVRYLDEARRLYLTTKRTGRVVQVGSQASSQEKWYKARDLVLAGKLGKPVWSQTSYCRNSVGGEWN
jgi:predicted dehydrogenase